MTLDITRSRLLSSDRARRLTILLALLGLVVRLAIIFPGPLESRVYALSNWADLRNYYWPAQAALKGENPYVLWQTGQSGEFRADMAPLELAVYVAAVAAWNDPRAIQLLFALFDVLNIILLGMLLSRSPLRLPLLVLYAISPLFLYNLVLVPEDKTIVLTLSFCLFYLLLRGSNEPLRVGRWNINPALAIMGVAGLIAAFKWLSVFFALPLAIYLSPNWRAFIRNGLVMAGVVILAHLLWFPSWWFVYVFRSARTATPLHIAPAVLLNAVGLFDKTILLILLVTCLVAVYLLFWFKRIDITEAIVLSVAVGVLWTPDMDPVHLMLVVVFFLLIVDWSQPGRMALVWVASTWVATVYAVSTQTALERYGLQWLRSITGNYGSVQMIVLSYVLFVVVFVCYLLDKRARRPVGFSVLLGAERKQDHKLKELLNPARALS